jgi:hypothetical protein
MCTTLEQQHRHSRQTDINQSKGATACWTTTVSTVVLHALPHVHVLSTTFGRGKQVTKVVRSQANMQHQACHAAD